MAQLNLLCLNVFRVNQRSDNELRSSLGANEGNWLGARLLVPCMVGWRGNMETCITKELSKRHTDSVTDKDTERTACGAIGGDRECLHTRMAVSL